MLRSAAAIIDSHGAAATIAGMDWFTWTPYIQYKVWGLVVIGVLAFVAGWMGFFNDSAPPAEEGQRDKGSDRSTH